MFELIIANIIPGSTVGIFKKNEERLPGFGGEDRKLIPLHVGIVFWDRLVVYLEKPSHCLVRVRTSRKRVTPRVPFEMDNVFVDKDTRIEVSNIVDHALGIGDLIEADRSIIGGLLEWAIERYQSAKINDNDPHVVMIKSVGTISYDGNNVQAINKGGKSAFILADPQLFDKMERHLNV